MVSVADSMAAAAAALSRSQEVDDSMSQEASMPTGEAEAGDIDSFFDGGATGFSTIPGAQDADSPEKRREQTESSSS